MSAWRNKTQPEIACPLDAVDPHAAIEMKRVIPDEIAIAEKGPQSIAGEILPRSPFFATDGPVEVVDDLGVPRQRKRIGGLLRFN